MTMQWSDERLDAALRELLDARATEIGAAALPVDEVSAQLADRMGVTGGTKDRPMSYILRFATVTAAAVVVAVVLGLFLGQPGGVVGPAPSASPDRTPTAVQTLPPTPTATSESTAEPTSAALRNGSLEAGSYTIDRPFPLRITFSVPKGWDGWHGFETSPWATAAGVWKPGSGVAYGTSIMFWVVGMVSADPCQASWMLDPPVGPAVDDLVTAIAGWPEPDITGPTDVTLNGHEGKRLEFTVPDDIGTCRNGSFEMWQTGEITRAPNPSDHHQLWILDVDGVRLVIEVVDSPGTSDQDRAELRHIFESIHIEKP
ncbi:MAG TPA: hypothetical protein VMP67_06125 [Candidatus Limnocylindria bacterium]|nr:hypothetical protein [Candidatus Limnocylindria bacterium]